MQGSNHPCFGFKGSIDHDRLPPEYPLFKGTFLFGAVFGSYVTLEGVVSCQMSTPATLSLRGMTIEASIQVRTITHRSEKGVYLVGFARLIRHDFISLALE